MLLKNPINMLLIFAAVLEALVTSGFSTFMPKFIQNQYGQTAGAAAMIGGNFGRFSMVLMFDLSLHYYPTTFYSLLQT